MKILAIASAGGHWIQLLRLKPSFEGHEIVFVTTQPSFRSMVDGHEFYYVPDANRWSKVKVLMNFIAIARLVIRTRPDLIITTGAAPGLMAVTAGKLLGCKSIWVDSIANVDHISLSGKIASKISDKTYTQWQHLSNSKYIYSGNVIQ